MTWILKSVQSQYPNRWINGCSGLSKFCGCTGLWSYTNLCNRQFTWVWRECARFLSWLSWPTQNSKWLPESKTDQHTLFISHKSCCEVLRYRISTCFGWPELTQSPANGKTRKTSFTSEEKSVPFIQHICKHMSAKEKRTHVHTTRILAY